MGSLLPGSTLQEWGGKEVVLTTLVQWSTRSPHSHLPGVVEKKEIHTVWRGGGEEMIVGFSSIVLVCGSGPQQCVLLCQL